MYKRQEPRGHACYSSLPIRELLLRFHRLKDDLGNIGSAEDKSVAEFGDLRAENLRLRLEIEALKRGLPLARENRALRDDNARLSASLDLLGRRLRDDICQSPNSMNTIFEIEAYQQSVNVSQDQTNPDVITD